MKKKKTLQSLLESLENLQYKIAFSAGIIAKAGGGVARISSFMTF
jgi:hypothetical protein